MPDVYLPSFKSRFAERTRQIWAILRLKPFDTDTETGRSRERHRRIALASLGSVLSRGINFLVMLITVPLTKRYLGAERYGLWMTITAIISMFSFADLGVGFGVVSALTRAHGLGDRRSAARAVTAGVLILALLATLIGVVFASVYPRVDWPKVLNLSSPLAAHEAGPAVAVLAWVTILTMPIGIIERVRMGLQDLSANYLWQSLGNVVTIATLFLAVYLKAGLPMLVFAATVPGTLAILGNGLHLFLKHR